MAAASAAGGGAATLNNADAPRCRAETLCRWGSWPVRRAALQEIKHADGCPSQRTALLLYAARARQTDGRHEHFCSDRLLLATYDSNVLLASCDLTTYPESDLRPACDNVVLMEPLMHGATVVMAIGVAVHAAGAFLLEHESGGGRIKQYSN